MKRCYRTWPGIDGSSDGNDEEVLGNLNIQVQLQLGEVLDELGIKPVEIVARREVPLEDKAWDKLLGKLGFSKNEVKR